MKANKFERGITEKPSASPQRINDTWEMRRAFNCFSQREIQPMLTLVQKLANTRKEISSHFYSPSYGMDLHFPSESSQSHTERFMGNNTWIPDQYDLRQSAGIKISFRNSKENPMNIEQISAIRDFFQELGEKQLKTIDFQVEIGNNVNPLAPQEQWEEIGKKAEIRLKERMRILSEQKTPFNTFNLYLNLRELSETPPDGDIVEQINIVIRHKSALNK